MNQTLEKWFPSALAVVITAASFYTRFPDALAHRIDTLSPILINLAAIAIGFLSTAQAVLLSLGGRKVIRKLQRHLMNDNRTFYQGVLSLISKAIWAASFLCLLALAGFFLNSGRMPNLSQAWAFAIILSGSYFAATIFRVLRIFSEIVHQASND